ncbi:MULTISPECIES: XisH family protein [Nostoc]|uniref:XisH family protein n=1 Tax=Nostoc paludosum FACHB-159 TaxID=2692908 RepID=A0ABR8K2M2_9NOSO|nr:MULTISPECIES: XisH family protein [Nostoc]MBD2677200.1 XisH family protein [Nostoc sp. FACHB-857]MBD2732991.1 XisH family protein [Nostoc paludosum FACHB-159]
MSARDLFHEAVKNALQKENWIVTDDPLKIEFEEVTFKIDLGAQRLIAAERAGEKIAVEIKSFASNSAVSDFHTALGQFLNYQIALEEKEPERQLYLAVPVDAYETFFQTRLAQIAVRRHRLKLIIYEPIMEMIVGWTN